MVRAEEFGPGQCVGDQQDVVDAGVERRGDLAEKQAGGLGIQRYRQVPGAGIGIGSGWTAAARPGSPPVFPGVGLFDDCRVVGVFSE